MYIYLELHISELLQDPITESDGERMEVTGKVYAKEIKLDYSDNPFLVVYIETVGNSPQRSNHIQCYMSNDGNKEPSIGEIIRVSGEVKLFELPTNPGQFNSRLYYSTLKISYRLKGCSVVKRNYKENVYKESIYKLRLSLEKIFDKCLNDKDSAVMKAIVLGDKAFMDSQTKELFQSGGIIHIMAVSGLHISVLAFGLYKLLRKLGTNDKISILVALIFIYSYGILCGMSVSAFRAILMFAIRISAPLFKRTYDMLSALSASGILLILDQPLYLYNSGFLFSFGAIIAISFVYPSLSDNEESRMDKMKFADDRQKRWEIVIKSVKNSLFMSFCLFLVTLPVYMSFYYKYSLYSAILNLVVIPLMAPLLVLGIICLFLGSIYVPLGMMAGFFIHIILSFYEFACEFVCRLPFSIWHLGHTSKLRIIIYVVLLFGIIKAPVLKKKVCRLPVNLILCLCLIPFLIFKASPDYKVSMIDVGQGDGILLEIDGTNILIDGGSSSKKNVGKYIIGPYLDYEGIGKIDMCLVTHEDKDHLSGVLELMDDVQKGYLKISTLALPLVNDSSKDDNYRILEQRARELGINLSYIYSGNKMNLPVTQGLFGKRYKVEITCLNPYKGMDTESANAHSIVLFVKYRDTKALFTGDVEEEGERTIIKEIEENAEAYGNITLYKAAHHGSAGTNSQVLLDLLKPKITFISCGKDNSYGHPHQETLDRLRSVGSAVYRTDQSGMLVFEVKNKKVTVVTY